MIWLRSLIEKKMNETKTERDISIHFLEIEIDRVNITNKTAAGFLSRINRNSTFFPIAIKFNSCFCKKYLKAPGY